MENIDVNEFLPPDEEDPFGVGNVPAAESKDKDGLNAKKETNFRSVHTINFKDLSLKSEIQRAITDCGFEHPSEVQQECIPQANNGRDVLCQAVSGFGKTAVFILSILQQLDDDPKPASALILCNTRELAYQIKKEFDRFSKYFGDLRKEVFFGGVPIAEDQKVLKDEKRTPHIIIGTPGRIQALCCTPAKDPALKLDNLQHFVLDECDKMLDETTMRQQVQKIFMSQNTTKKSLQVMMFSATLSEATKKVCRLYMQEPYELVIESETKLNLHGLKQYFVKLEENQKIKKLVDILDELHFNQVIIFTRTNENAQKLNDIIQQEKFPSIACCRNMEMRERLRVFQQFKEGKYRIMICTDLLGRGIDIERINIVVNFDMPNETDQYLHRVGRAGRFGTKGLAISFISSQEDADVLTDVQSRFAVKVEELPSTIDKSTYMNN